MDHIALAETSAAQISHRERVLLDYVRVLTLEPANVKDADVERLRRVGWTDEQIFEASFITALFAFFNRMADAYGLDYQPDRWVPPALRSTLATRAPAPPSADPAAPAAATPAAGVPPPQAPAAVPAGAAPDAPGSPAKETKP